MCDEAPRCEGFACGSGVSVLRGMCAGGVQAAEAALEALQAEDSPNQGSPPESATTSQAIQVRTPLLTDHAGPLTFLV